MHVAKSDFSTSNTKLSTLAPVPLCLGCTRSHQNKPQKQELAGQRVFMASCLWPTLQDHLFIDLFPHPPFGLFGDLTLRRPFQGALSVKTVLFHTPYIKDLCG